MVHQRLSKAENPGSCRLPGFSIPFLDRGNSRRRGLSSPQAGGLPIIFCFFCYPAICRCNTRSHRPKPKGQKIRRYPRLSPPSIAKESATCLVYQMFAGSTRFACKRTQRGSPGCACAFFCLGPSRWLCVHSTAKALIFLRIFSHLFTDSSFFLRANMV